MVKKLNAIKEKQMKNYIYENLWTQKLENEIESSLTKPLIIEMYYKYGLKVYDTKLHSVWNKRIHKSEDIREFFMTLNGVGCCSVYTREGKDKKLEYVCYSPNYSKNRAYDDMDRGSIYSVKLSNVIKMIDKHKAIRFDSTEIIQHQDIIGSFKHLWERSLSVEKERKRLDMLDTRHIQKLIAYTLNRIEKKDIDEETLRLSKVCLDNWTEIDKNNETVNNIIRSTFCKDFYLVGVDEGEGLIIGKLVAEADEGYSSLKLDLSRNIELNEIEPFQRVKSIEDYEYKNDIIPVLTMLKLTLESSRNETIKHGVPCNLDKAFLDLNVASYYKARGSYYMGAWLLIPTTN
jgi:hypothetical protein